MKITPESALQIIAPLPLSVNQYYTQMTRDSRTYKFVSKKGKDYKALIKELCAEHLEHCAKYFKHPHRLSLMVLVKTKDKRRRDLDNFQKCLLDALQDAGVCEDDEQFDNNMWFRHSHVRSEKNEILICLAQIEGWKLEDGTYNSVEVLKLLNK